MMPETLTAYRESLAMDKTHFARLLGVYPSAISQWESGTRKIPHYIVNHVKALKTIEEYRQPKLPLPIPDGLCRCGCGGFTEINTRNDTAKGWVRGEYRAYISGHNIKVQSRG